MCSQGIAEKPSPQRPVILYDGGCGLCQSSVRFIIARDYHTHYRFAAFQSDTGRVLASQAGIDSAHLNTLVLWDGTRAHVRSGAALRVARRLSGLWPLCAVALIIPPFIRDGVYTWIARNRYRWFGAGDTTDLEQTHPERFRIGT